MQWEWNATQQSTSRQVKLMESNESSCSQFDSIHSSPRRTKEASNYRYLFPQLYSIVLYCIVWTRRSIAMCRIVLWLVSSRFDFDCPCGTTPNSHYLVRIPIPIGLWTVTTRPALPTVIATWQVWPWPTTGSRLRQFSSSQPWLQLQPNLRHRTIPPFGALDNSARSLAATVTRKTNVAFWLSLSKTYLKRKQCTCICKWDNCSAVSFLKMMMSLQILFCKRMTSSSRSADCCYKMLSVTATSTEEWRYVKERKELCETTNQITCKLDV